MYKMINREMAEVTPEKAEGFLRYNNYVTQRKIRPAHVTELASKMKNGTFRFGDVAFATFDNNKYMMNGQHICTAIANTGMSQPCVIEYFYCENEMDMSLLFKQFENLPRSLNDMIAVESHALGLDWSLSLASMVVAAGGILEAGSSRFTSSTGTSGSVAHSKTYMTKEIRVGFLKKYIREGDFVKRVVFDHLTTETAHLKRAAVVAMMIKSWRKSKDGAETFWAQVRDGENLTKKMPAWLLREFLKSHNIISFRNQITYRKATNHEIAYRTALTWNAFRENRKISKTSYFPDKEIPSLV